MKNKRDEQYMVLSKDSEGSEIQVLFSGLRGDSSALDSESEADLLQCARMALYHGWRIGLKSQDAFDALALICLVLGERRQEFFADVFLNRMMLNPNLTAREKLNRIIEVVIGTVPRTAPKISNDNTIRESA